MFSQILRVMSVSNVIISILIGIVAIIGDELVAKMSKFIERAVTDNATHAIIGGLSWLIVTNNVQYFCTPVQKLLEIIICTLISSFIDLDHFLVAGSFNHSVCICMCIY